MEQVADEHAREARVGEGQRDRIGNREPRPGQGARREADLLGVAIDAGRGAAAHEPGEVRALTAADLEAGEGEPVEPGQEQGVLDGREAPISGRPAVVSGVGACEVAVLHRLEAVAGPHLMVPYHGR